MQPCHGSAARFDASARPGRSTPGVTSVGRGPGVDLVLDDPTVSRLHAELVRRGPYVYVTDLGLPRNGTLANEAIATGVVQPPRDPEARAG